MTHSLPAVEPTPRNLHYGAFYDLAPIDEGKPLLLVHGNCQAESLRVLLEGHFGHEVTTARLVPAHELSADDVPYLHRILRRASLLVTQPIVAGYRGLPVGTADLQQVAPQPATCVVPVLRWAGLHPTQAIVRSSAGDPPVAPYHDLRTVLEATTGKRPHLGVDAARSLRAMSLAALRERTERHAALAVDDLLALPGRRTVHVINHPTNAVLEAVATRLGERLGLGEPRAFDPGRTLLGSVVAPVEEAAATVNGLDADPDDTWLVAGERVPGRQVREAHLAWYARHPEALDAALTRHREALEILGGAR